MNDNQRIRISWYFSARMRAVYATNADDRVYWLRYATDQIVAYRRDSTSWFRRNDR